MRLGVDHTLKWVVDHNLRWRMDPWWMLGADHKLRWMEVHVWWRKVAHSWRQKVVVPLKMEEDLACEVAHSLMSGVVQVLVWELP